jgi:hypothetical protein
MKLRRSKSKKAKAADALGTFLKVETVTKAAKGATKAAKGTATTAAKPTPVKRVALFLAAAAAAAFVALKLRGGEDQQADAEGAS